MIDQASIEESYGKYGEHTDEQKKGILGQFGKKELTGQIIGADMTGQLRDFSRRLRLLEERYANQRKNLQVLEHNMISESKKIQQQERVLQQDIDDIKKQLYQMKQQFDIVSAALRDTAKREDVVVLEKYINLWEPLNFVTRKEVEKLVSELLENNAKRSLQK